MSSAATFILVGHCWADRMGLKSFLKQASPGAPIVKANDRKTLETHLADGDTVLLVNRVLDGRFGVRGGVELIRELVEAGHVRLILVSNYPDAQQEAVAAGALPGFGKSELHTSEARARLQAAAS